MLFRSYALRFLLNNDYIAHVHYSREILKHIPHAEFVLVPDCGHTCTVEKPETVNSIITGFILKNDICGKIKNV